MFEELSISQILLSTLFIVLALGAAFWAGSRTETLRQTFVALGAQWALTIALFEYIGRANDVNEYVRRAALIIDFTTGERPFPGGLTKLGLPLVWSLVEASVVWHPLPAALLLAIPVSLIPSVTAHATRLLGFASAASTSAWLGALGLPMLVWSPWLRREGLSYFLISLVLLSMAWTFAGHWRKGLVLAVALAPALLLTRGQLVLVAAVAIPAAVILSPQLPSRARFSVLSLWGLGTILIMPLAISSLYVGESLARQLRFLSEGGTLSVSFSSYEHNTSLVGIARNTVHALFGPFPWEWQNERWLVFGVDGLIYLVAFILLILVYRSGKRIRRQFWLLVLPVIPMVLGSAVLLSNYGLNSRIRSHFLILLLPLLAVGLDRLRRGTEFVSGGAPTIISRIEATASPPMGSSVNCKSGIGAFPVPQFRPSGQRPEFSGRLGGVGDLAVRKRPYGDSVAEAFRKY